MSYQGGGYYQNHSTGEALPSSNPWAEETGLQQNQPQLQQPLQPQQAYQSQQAPETQQWNSQASYQAPQYHASRYQAPPGPPPRRTDTFQDERIVPPEERGEQREAMENFELHNTKPESEADRAVAALSNEFPNIDSALIAALFSDSQNVGATREMLQELATS